MNYKLINEYNKLVNIKLTTDEDIEVLIPIHEANTDYQAYLEWVADGNTPEEAD